MTNGASPPEYTRFKLATQDVITEGQYTISNAADAKAASDEGMPATRKSAPH